MGDLQCWTQLNRWRLQVSFGVSSCRTLAPLWMFQLSRSKAKKKLQTYTKTEEQTPSIELEIPISRCSFRCLSDVFWDFYKFSRFLCITFYRNARFSNQRVFHLRASRRDAKGIEAAWAVFATGDLWTTCGFFKVSDFIGKIWYYICVFLE